jgi:hypothetical protein
MESGPCVTPLNVSLLFQETSVLISVVDSRIVNGWFDIGGGFDAPDALSSEINALLGRTSPYSLLVPS